MSSNQAIKGEDKYTGEGDVIPITDIWVRKMLDYIPCFGYMGDIDKEATMKKFNSFYWIVSLGAICFLAMGCPTSSKPGAPSISSVDPATVTNNVNTVITINGGGFLNGLTAEIGAQGLIVNSVSSSQVKATVIAGMDAGTYDISVTNIDGQKATLSQALTVENPSYPVPTVSSINPSSGSTSYDGVINVSGTNFVSGATAKMGIIPLSFVYVKTSTELFGIVPAGMAPGNYSLTVTNPDGQSGTGGSYTVLQAPVITDVEPGNGKPGDTIVITGNYFGDTRGENSGVSIGSSWQVTVVSWSNTSIQAIVPKDASCGQVYVVLNNQQSNGYFFPIIPVIESIYPPKASANTRLLISGTGFNPMASLNAVTMTPGGAATVISASSTQLITTQPAGLGNVSVTVQGLGGCNNVSNSKSYTSVAQGTIDVLAAGIARPFDIKGDSQGNLYVANMYNDTISKVYTDPSGSSITGMTTFATFPYGSYVAGLAFSINGDLFAITNDMGIYRVSPSGSVTQMNPSGFSLSCPYQADFDENGYLYIADPCGPSIFKVSVSGNTLNLVSNIGAGFGPYGILAENGQLFVSNWGGNVYHLTTDGANVSTYGGFSCSYGMSMNRETCHLLVTDTCDYSLNTLYPSGITNSLGRTNIFQFSPILYGPKGVERHSNGSISVVNEYSNAITTFEPLSSWTQDLMTMGFTTPWGMTTAPNGYVYVADFGNSNAVDGAIYRIDPNNGTRTALTLAGVSLTDPISIAFDKNGNLYVGEDGTGGATQVVYQFRQTGATSYQWVRTYTNGGAGFYYPYGLALDNSAPQRLYIASWNMGYVYQQVTDTTSAPTLLQSLGYSPFGIAIDKNNIIYVSLTGLNSIAAFTPSTPPGSWWYLTPDNSYGLSNPRALAVNNCGTLLVLNEYGNPDGGSSVVSIDTKTGGVKHVFYIDQFMGSEPYGYGMTLDLAGRIWFADYQNDCLVRAKPSYPQPTGIFQSPISYPMGLTMDPKGNLLVANGNGYDLQDLNLHTPIGKVSPVNGLMSSLYINPSEIKYPFGLAVDSSENLYASIFDWYNYDTDPFMNTVRKTNVYYPWSGYSTLASGFTNPAHIVFRQGNLYVAEQAYGGGKGKISKVTPSGIKTDYSTGLNQPWGLAFSPTGELFVSEQYNEAVRMIPASGGAAQSFIPGLDWPTGLAVNQIGANTYLYVLNHSINGELNAYDVNNPGSPVFVANLWNAGLPAYGAANEVHAVVVDPITNSLYIGCPYSYWWGNPYNVILRVAP